jgi:hypothetical protein
MVGQNTDDLCLGMFNFLFFVVMTKRYWKKKEIYTLFGCKPNNFKYWHKIDLGGDICHFFTQVSTHSIL